MGWGKKKKGQNQKPGGPSWGTKNKRGQGYDEIIKENAIFEGYYKLQKIVPEDEWDAFMSHLKDPLPTTFRISGSGNQSEGRALLKIIESQYFKDLTEEQTKPECLSWYPGNVAWQLNLTRKDIRKSEANVKLHQFLVSETETGNITRQETVSMIPPLVLDIQSHHKVLDMCAAPGSKTSQLIEMLHSEEGKIPEGLVIANDSNNQRCYMLVHQLKRLHSPNVMITNHDATVFPSIKISAPDGGETTLKFDRVLCDVPCSGDGTLRKNFDVWMKWNTANSTSLNGIQYRIARRGAELLNVGGKMVYSTCSLNPLEDEAVLHRLLIDAQGSLELVELGDKLPGLKYSRGLNTWTITARDLTVYPTPDDVPEALKNQLRPCLFPPKPEDAEKFHFERCMRVLPHQQNTGGFFIALLQKVAPLPWESASRPMKAEAPAVAATDTVEAVEQESTQGENNTAESEAVQETRPRSPQRKKRRMQGFKEDPFFFFEPSEEAWPKIKEFYGMDDALNHTLLFSRRSDDKRRNIYYTTPLGKDITKRNEEKLTIINTGVKVLSRSDNKGTDCGFRVAQEGAIIMLDYITRRRVKISLEDVILLLLNDDMEEPPEIHKFSPNAAAQFHDLTTGSILVEYNDEMKMHIVLVAWKGNTSVRAYVAKAERVHYLRLCGVDASKFQVNKFAKEREENEEPVESSAINSSFLLHTLPGGVSSRIESVELTLVSPSPLWETIRDCQANRKDFGRHVSHSLLEA